jgi:hypothetical protein
MLWSHINLLIFISRLARKHFLGLVDVFKLFMGLHKDISNQFYEIVVTIIGEEILQLNGYKLGHESWEGHLCVLM